MNDKVTTHVDLFPAWFWLCPFCARKNFECGVDPELSPEEIDEVKAELGIEDSREGEFVMTPEVVTCSHCGKIFPVDFGDDNEESSD